MVCMSRITSNKVSLFVSLDEAIHEYSSKAGLVIDSEYVTSFVRANLVPLFHVKDEVFILREDFETLFPLFSHLLQTDFSQSQQYQPRY